MPHSIRLLASMCPSILNKSDLEPQMLRVISFRRLLPASWHSPVPPHPPWGAVPAVEQAGLGPCSPPVQQLSAWVRAMSLHGCQHGALEVKEMCFILTCSVLIGMVVGLF